MVASRKKPRFKPRPCTVEVRDWEGTNHKGTYRIENGDLFVSTGSGSEFVRSSADNELHGQGGCAGIEWAPQAQMAGRLEARAVAGSHAEILDALPAAPSGCG